MILRPPFSCNVNLQPIAVDNVLEQFVKINEDKLLREEQILRVATDPAKMNQDLQHLTLDARIGGGYESE